MRYRVSGATAVAILAGASVLLTAPPASALCARTTERQDQSDAHQIFVAQALQGPTRGGTTGTPNDLLSPARFRVDHYLKGSGPRTVLVETAFTKQGNFIAALEEAITPQAGEWWVIFSESAVKGVIQTSICEGSRRISGPDAFVLLPATGSQTAWLSLGALIVALIGLLLRLVSRRSAKGHFDHLG